MSSKFFSQVLRRSSRQNKVDHDLGLFLTSKISPVIQPRTGHFRGLIAGFEAKAKDLTLEAKDFKLSPQERF